MKIGRRTLLAGVAAVAGGFAINWRMKDSSRAVPLPKVAVAGLPSQDDVWRWIVGLNAFGPRLTGNAAHVRSVDYLASEMASIGLEVKRDKIQFRRWEADRLDLAVDGNRTVRISSALPYSGLTPASGVSGKLVWFNDRPDSYAEAKGGIAVVRIERQDLSATMLGLAFNRQDNLGKDADFDRPFTTPLITGLKAVDLKAARDAGVLGVVVVYDGITTPQLAGQDLPFTTPYAGIPSVWVDAAEGEVLRASALRSETARLTLTGVHEPAESETLFAVLPGSNPNETIIVNTHTDGPNACEENGAAGVLALASTFAKLPIEQRRRTMVFVLVTGHFQIPQFGIDGRQATSRWLASHRELWDGANGHAKAVAALTLEHLGCTEWKDDLAAGAPAPTGKLELDLVYVANQTLRRVYARSTEKRSKLRALTVSPRFPALMFGEGQPLYQEGIPVISNCPLPDYLCQVLPDGGLNRLDPDYAHQQIASYAHCLATLDRLSTDQIGAIPKSFLGGLTGILKLIGLH